MRLLYLSVHAPLEFDELSILRDEGFDVFSPGSEPAPVGPDGGDATLLLRPPVAGLSHDLDTVRAWREICLADSSVDPKLRIPAAFLRRFDAVVVMSHHLESDRVYLRQLAASDIRYIGLLGPRGRRRRLLNDLGSDVATALGDRLHGPAGLPLGGRGPAPIALSIVAEMHQVLVEA